MKKILYSIGLPLVIIALLFSAIGCEGPVGPQGAQGIQGAAGPAGPAGATGATGLRGATGPIGTPIVWLGALSKAPNYPDLNDAYYNSTHGISYVWDGKHWQVLAKDGAVGATGGQGASGPRGYTGAAGAQGPIGLLGPEGPQGKQGDTGEQGIQGDKGDTGDTGPQGPQGDQGLIGPAGEDGTFSYTLQMGTCSIPWGATPVGYDKVELKVVFDPSFENAPLVFATVTLGTRLKTNIALWDVAVIETTTSYFIVEIGSDRDDGATVTVNWLAISQ
ncbi:hypothetical protein ES708_34653 [subsurface metagenome]